MMDFLTIDITGVKDVKRILDNLPPAVQREIIDEVSPLIVKRLQQYPGYKEITRAAAYPEAPGGAGWFSSAKKKGDRPNQRGYVMMMIRRGVIKKGNNRTERLKNGWLIKERDEGKASVIINTVPYAKYVISDDRQSRHEALVGWRTTSKIISMNLLLITNRIVTAATKAIRKLGVRVG